jgi:hypothetical protein
MLSLVNSDNSQRRTRADFLDFRATLTKIADSVAEGVGFEPTVTFRPRRFSRPVPSTARPPLRLGSSGQLGLSF